MLYIIISILFAYLPVMDCDIDVSVPDNFSVCEEDDYDLDGDIDGDYLDFEWTSDLGYSNTSDLNPSVFIDQDQTFTLCARAINDDNLVDNGDFENGMSGFSSDYVFNPSTGVGGLAQGSFNIDNVTPFLWTNCPAIDGDMMVVNAATVTNVEVYCTDVNVDPDTDYIFSADVMNINNPAPILQFSINGSLLGSSFVGGAPCSPEEFYETWNSGSNSTATICLVNQNTAGAGNDFALDNVLFRELCVIKESFTISFSDYTLSLDVSNDIDCNDPLTPVSVDIDVNNVDFLYEWEDVNGESIGTEFDDEIIVSEPGIYYVTVTDENNCSKEDWIEVFGDVSLPQFDFEIPDTLNCNANSIELIVNTNNNNDVLWITPDGEELFVTNIYTPDSGLFELIVTDFYSNCSDTALIHVALDTSVQTSSIEMANPLDCDNSVTYLFLSDYENVEQVNWFFSDVIVPNQDTISVSEGGIYFSETTFSNGCRHLDSLVISQHVPVFNYNLDFDSVINCTLAFAQINVEIEDLTQSVLWNSVQDIDDPNATLISVDEGGWYYVTIMDSLNCSTRDSVFIDAQFSLPTFNEVIDSITCTNAVASIGLMDMVNVDSIHWIGPNNSEYFGSDIQVNSPGLYNYEVFGFNGCTALGTIEVMANSSIPVLNIEGDFMLNCSNPNSMLIGQSNIPIQSSNWELYDNSVVNLDSIMVTQAGLYTYNVLTNEGCEVSYEVNVVLDTISPDVNIDPDTILNCNIQELTNTFESNANIIQVQWTDDQNNVLSVTDSILHQTEGSFQLEIMSDNGCTSSYAYEVEYDTITPSLEASVDTINCVQLSALIDVNTDGNEYFIYDELNTLLTSNTPYSALNPGLYSIVSSNSNGCQSNLQIEVPTDTISPNIIIDLDTLTCQQLAVVPEILNVSGNESWVWTFENQVISTASNPPLSESGIYEVEVIGLNGCQQLISDVLEIDTSSYKPILVLDSLNCDKPMVDIPILNYTEGIDYEWTDISNTLSQDSIFTVEEAGTYSLISTPFNGCVDTTIFMINDLSTQINIGIETDNVTLDCSNTNINLSVDMMSPSYSFEWILDGQVLDSVAVLNIEEEGKYVLQVTDENNCVGLDSIDIAIDTLVPILTLSVDTLNCLDSIANIELLNTNPNTMYSFTTGSGLMIQNTSASFTEAELLSILAIGENGCENQLAYQIPIDTLIEEVSLVSDSLSCKNDSVLISLSPLLDDYTFSWQQGGNILSSNEDLFVSQAGNYQLLYTHVNNGCQAKANIDVARINDVPYAFDMDLLDPLCGEDDFSFQTFEVLGGVEPFLIEINGIDTDVFSNENNLQAGQNTISIQDVNECVHDTSFTLSTVSVLDIELINLIDISWNVDHEIELTLNRNEDEIVNITWSDATNLSCNDCLNPIVNISQNESFQVIVEDLYGCIDTAIIEIRVEADKNIFIPNVFTPFTNDVDNNIFKALAPDGVVKRVNSFQIFDRWGNRMFSQMDLDIADPQFGWNGYFGSEKLQSGVYAYIFEIEFIDGEIKYYPGTITLID